MASPLITVLDANNHPTGPFRLHEIQRRLQTGEFRPDQLAHAEGLPDWTPLNVVVAHVAGPLRRSAFPATTGLSATISPAAEEPEHQTVYAGFWLRAIACLLDYILIAAVIYALVFLLVFAVNPHGLVHDLRTGSRAAMDTAPMWIKLLVLPIAVFGPPLYFAVMESGPQRATLGKMAVGLIVTDLEGEAITFWRALARTAAKLVTNLTVIVFYLGYIMAGFTPRKQALHDYIARTLVMRE